MHRGRLVDHVQLVVADIGASKRFYGAVRRRPERTVGGGGRLRAAVGRGLRLQLARLGIGRGFGNRVVQRREFSLDLEAELLHCDTIDLSARGLGGTYTISENELVASGTTFSFCVDGDTLLLWDRAAASPDMSVLELVRSGS